MSSQFDSRSALTDRCKGENILKSNKFVQPHMSTEVCIAIYVDSVGFASTHKK